MKRYCGGLSSRASKYQTITKSNSFHKNKQEKVGRFYTVGRIDQKKWQPTFHWKEPKEPTTNFTIKAGKYVGLILHSRKRISCKEQGAVSLRVDPLGRTAPYVFAFSS